MTELDLDTPQAQVAQEFMRHKGLKKELPVDIEKLDGKTCWYFYYELPEGDLELEVLWENDEWQCAVTTFTLVE